MVEENFDRWTMNDQLKFSNNAFADWTAFQAELEKVLTGKLQPDAVARVMGRTRDAYSRMQLASLTRTFRPEEAEQMRRYEAFSKEFKTVQMRLLSMLITSFITLEQQNE